MKYFCKDLNELYPLKGGVLKCYIMDNPWDADNEGRENWKRPAVIVVPGGGYHFISNREGETVASKFFAAGFQCFVLEYLVRPQGASYPEQLFELSCAIDYVKKNAKDFCINADEIFTIGFSAGGHLVADQSCEYPTISKRMGVKLECDPKAVALSYAVINNQSGTFDNLLFSYPESEKNDLKKRLMADKLVGKHTPPTFIWTTAEDSVVPPTNSLDYASALTKANVPFELHIYPKGNHGKSSGAKEINYPADDVSAYDEWKCLSAWINDCIRFFGNCRNVR